MPLSKFDIQYVINLVIKTAAVASASPVPTILTNNKTIIISLEPKPPGKNDNIPVSVAIGKMIIGITIGTFTPILKNDK